MVINLHEQKILIMLVHMQLMVKNQIIYNNFLHNLKDSLLFFKIFHDKMNIMKLYKHLHGYL